MQEKTRERGGIERVDEVDASKCVRGGGGEGGGDLLGEVTVIMAAKPPLAIMTRRNETRMPVRIEAVKYWARPEAMMTKRTCTAYTLRQAQRGAEARSSLQLMCSGQTIPQTTRPRNHKQTYKHKQTNTHTYSYTHHTHHTHHPLVLAHRIPVHVSKRTGKAADTVMRISWPPWPT